MVKHKPHLLHNLTVKTPVDSLVPVSIPMIEGNRGHSQRQGLKKQKKENTLTKAVKHIRADVNGRQIR